MNQDIQKQADKTPVPAGKGRVSASCLIAKLKPQRFPGSEASSLDTTAMLILPRANGFTWVWSRERMDRRTQFVHIQT
jgi:hypothetical protein